MLCTFAADLGWDQHPTVESGVGRQVSGPCPLRWLPLLSRAVA